MASDTTRMRRGLPLLVILVALYQLAKALFFAYVFSQCSQAQGSGIPPFGGDVHNPMFESPFMYLFLLLAVFQLAICMGLFCRGDWARKFCLFLPVGAIPWWFLEHMVGHRSLLFPVESSTMLSAFALEVIAIAILYVTPEAKEAFAPIN